MGSDSGRDMPDKLARHGVQIFTAPGSDLPLVEGCVGWLACRLVPEPHNQQAYDLFIGEVVAFHLSDAIYDGTRVDAARMRPISRLGGPLYAGLGEIFQFVVKNDAMTLMELEEQLDWFIAPQLRMVPGIVEVNSFGGEIKQYQVLADPFRMRSHGVTLTQLQEALADNNRNAGGAYIRKENEQQLIQGIGLIESLKDIESIVLSAKDGVPVLVGDVATVEFGAALRQGTITKDGKGEAVAAIAVMLVGENSRTVTQRVKELSLIHI